MINFDQVYREILHDNEMAWNDKEIYDFFIKNDIPVLSYQNVKHRAIDEWRKHSLCVPYDDTTSINNSYVEDFNSKPHYDYTSVIDFHELVKKVLIKINNLNNQYRVKVKVFKLFWAYITMSVPEQALACKKYFLKYLEPEDIELNNKIIRTSYDIESYIGYKSDYSSLNTGYIKCLSLIQNILSETIQESVNDISSESKTNDNVSNTNDDSLSENE